MKNCKYVIGGALVAAAGVAICLDYCKTTPHGVKVVQNFKKEKYLGKWYEIARFDFRHEKNMNQTTAEYSLNEDGTIRVVNRGYDYKKGEWKEAIGKAKFVGSSNEGKLKVSFLGPFYAGYNVLAVDEDYKYALVVGKNHHYMWILSREKTIPEEIKQEYIHKAEIHGFNTDNLVWVEQK